MKTSELIDAPLDYWAAKSEGYMRPRIDVGVCVVDMPDGGQFDPSTNWAVGGPIIERERISTRSDDETLYGQPQNQWLAEHPDLGYAVEGPTHLIAAMRAYVASKFGDEVPD